jgi:hypothetical protein
VGQMEKIFGVVLIEIGVVDAHRKLVISLGDNDQVREPLQVEYFIDEAHMEHPLLLGPRGNDTRFGHGHECHEIGTTLMNATPHPYVLELMVGAEEEAWLLAHRPCA